MRKGALEDIEWGHVAAEDDSLEAVAARKGVNNPRERVDELCEAPEGDTLEAAGPNEHAREQTHGICVGLICTLFADSVAAELKRTDKCCTLGMSEEGRAEGTELGVR